MITFMENLKTVILWIFTSRSLALLLMAVNGISCCDTTNTSIHFTPNLSAAMLNSLTSNSNSLP